MVEPLTFRLNGRAVQIPRGPPRSLLAMLRVELGLTGTKYGCGEGECGACTVLLDDRPVRACQVKVAEIENRRVTTVEGLADGEKLSPVQRAFAETGAYQCGYCTPGMVVAATAFLKEHPQPSAAEVRVALESHICRCGGYSRILEAVLRAAQTSEHPREGVP